MAVKLNDLNSSATAGISPREAVREAVRRLSASSRAYAHNVPLEAERILKASSSGTVSTDEASRQVRQAIKDMVEEGELLAPAKPSDDWKLLK